jgi:hypothetical protein
MTQPLNPPINIYLQPGETIGHALMRVALIARGGESLPIQIHPGVHICGSDYQDHPRTHIIERRTTGIPFLEADGADISIRDTPMYKDSGPPPLTLP